MFVQQSDCVMAAYFNVIDKKWKWNILNKFEDYEDEVKKKIEINLL